VRLRKRCSWSIALCLLLLTAACNLREEAAATSEAATLESKADEEDFVAACLSASNMGRDLCTCIAGKAKAELSETGYAFVLASLRSDEARTVALRSALTIQEATSAGTFMTRAPGKCAAEAQGIP
jgi:hypothetical protein